MPFFLIIVPIIIVVAVVMIIRQLKNPHLLKQAEKDIKIRYYTAAIEKLKKLLKVNAKNYEAHKLIGKAYKLSGQYEAAVKAFRTSLENIEFETLDSEIMIRKNLAESFAELGQYQEAIEEYLLVTKISSKDEEIYLNLGKLYLDLNQNDGAIENLTKAAHINKRNHETRFLLGECLYKSGLHIKSAKMLEESLRLKPNNSKAHYYLGHIYTDQQNYNKAIEHFTQAKKSKETKIPACRYLGKVYYLSDNLEKTIEILKEGLSKATNENENTTAMNYYLGLAHEDQKDYAAAMKYFETVHNFDPNFMDIKDKMENYSHIKDSEVLKKFMFADEEEFTAFCGKIIEKLGYVEHDRKGSSHDIYECILKEIEKSVGTKTKKYYLTINRGQHDVQEEDLRNMLDKIKGNNCIEGIYVTTNELNHQARQFANSRPIIIHTANDLEKMLH